MCQEAHIEHRLIPPRHPQTNGMVERFNGRIAEIMRSERFNSSLQEIAISRPAGASEARRASAPPPRQNAESDASGFPLGRVLAAE